MALEVKITNMLRIKDAQIKLEAGKTTLVHGHNAAGKTSLATLAAGILTGDANPAGAARSSKSVYVHDGEEMGFVDLKFDNTTLARWDGRAGEMANWTAEDGPQPSSDGAVGLVDFCAAMSQPARTALWENYFLPSDEELYAKIEKQLARVLSKEQCEEVMSMVGEGDLDVVMKSYEKWMRDAKRKWMEVAGSNWGKAKAADWLPEGWTHELDGITESAAEEALALAREALRAQHVTLAISTSDIEKAQAAAERLMNANQELAELKTEAEQAKERLRPMSADVSAAKKKVSELTAKLAVLSKEYKPKENVLTCPECESPLMLDPVTSKLVKHDLSAEVAAQKERREQRAALENDIIEAQGAVRSLREVMEPHITLVNNLDNKIAEMSGRIAELKLEAQHADKTPTEDNSDAVYTAEQEVERLRDALDLIKKRSRAFRHHEDVIAYEAIVKTLGPKGVRATSMEKAMQRFDNTLNTISSVTGWPRVKVDRSYGISIGERTLLRVCAESERLRTQYSLQIAIARCQREPVVVLDGVDHLDADNRARLMKLLNTLCARPEPPSFLICGTDLDHREMNPAGINYKIRDGVAIPEATQER